MWRRRARRALGFYRNRARAHEREAMELIYVALGAVVFLALCGMAAVIGLRRAISDLRYWAEMHDGHRAQDCERLQTDVWAMRCGMETLGLQYKPKETRPGEWIKKDAA